MKNKILILFMLLVFIMLSACGGATPEPTEVVVPEEAAPEEAAPEEAAPAGPEVALSDLDDDRIRGGHDASLGGRSRRAGRVVPRASRDDSGPRRCERERPVRTGQPQPAASGQ